MARGRPLVLSRREYDLLRELANRQGRILTRAEILSAVWGRAFDPADRSVDVYVRKLRVKLASALPAWTFIHTHPGFGYRFAPEPASQLVYDWDTGG
jgi:DNA-binding response OmpR family regulator